ncbi:alanine racemase [Aquimarina mytili]|uniref:Alanine racemase n=1 Tax=Aquimarina mytili TaxID=874423 RepID=A0A936ZZT0_9FLAO|nr:alanine racemase [Aquimarina mytili]MBL0685386.1 alanine racemase [Aquimarina mytili]
MSKTSETILEINLAHLTHNFNHLKSKLDPEVKVLAVVKASGYGSDAAIIARHLEKIGADYFAVAYTSEGIQLRDAGITTPILVLHPQPVNFQKLIDYQLEPSVYSARVLKEFLVTAKLNGKKHYPIHVKFNTGLNRIGFDESDVDYITKQISATDVIKVVSLLSHLAASEDYNEREFTLNQINSFKQIANKVSAKLGYTPILHQSNTSGIFNYPEAHFDMVRTGIGLYGYGNEAKYDTQLKPVMSLKSVISQIHDMQPGDSLGYNRAFIASEATKTATIPIGHADGIGRQYGNKKGYVIIHNQRAYILGNVCMDMIMVDITTIDCKEGDEVIIFGSESSAANIAEHSGTISYELLTAVSPRVKRTVIDDK